MIAAIIQARIGSTRLPGKTLEDICGHPMLWHLVNRVRHAKEIDSVVIAIPQGSLDDSIASFCDEEEINCFRGSEKDVLDRYYQAAKWIRADIIVRITADCPLIDPLVIDKVVSAYLDGECDYAGNTIICTYPDGLDTEVFSFGVLEKTWRCARLVSEREHVTPYILKNTGIFKLRNVKCETDLSHLRWTVDELRDLIFVRKIYEALYEPNSIFLMDDVVKLLEKRSDLLNINKGIIRDEGYLRSLKEDTEIDSLPI